MAIDTDNKKYSLIYSHMPWSIKPITAIAFTQGDKQQLLFEYPGILWGVAVTFDPESITGNSYQTNSVSGNSNQDISLSNNSNQATDISGYSNQDTNVSGNSKQTVSIIGSSKL